MEGNEKNAETASLLRHMSPDWKEVAALAEKLERGEPLQALPEKLFSELLETHSFKYFDNNIHREQDMVTLASRRGGSKYIEDILHNINRERGLNLILPALLGCGLRLSEEQAEQFVSSMLAELKTAETENGNIGGYHESVDRIHSAAMFAKDAFLLTLISAAPQLSTVQLERAFSVLSASDKLLIMEKYVSEGGLMDAKASRLFQETISSITRNPNRSPSDRVDAFNLRKKLEAAKPKSACSAFPPKEGLPKKPPQMARRI